MAETKLNTILNFLKGFYEYDESIFATVDTRKKGKTQQLSNVELTAQYHVPCVDFFTQVMNFLCL